MAEHTVSAGFARGLMELAVAKGADRAALLAQAGVSAEALADHDSRIPFSRYVALMRAGQALSGDAALALHYGEQVDISQVSIVGLLGQASETMLEAFQQVNRYVRLIVETENVGGGARFGMAFEAGKLWLIDNRANPNDFPELTESAFAQLISGPRRIDPRLLPKAVHVTHAERPYRAEYERVFGAPVTFGAARNAIQLDEALGAQPVRRLPRYAFGVLSDKAEALLKSLEQSQSIRGRVEAQLMTLLHTGEAGMERVAARLGLSRQTLFRRLKDEGVTFETVLDELRHRLALHYLAGGKVSVNETAYLVGFSEPAAFSRAFKRWTGMSPKAMRGGSEASPVGRSGDG